ncbi:hypothetical protein BESB_052970 [Besnoitia besnoiti]|uniref:Uncharacterized protein n=1 Tax=Besnoitia besnoiti TaxID=94643 RepID=A0A2A9MI62_BESBE|nr:hypothetical protein BESB_052970 [Besnoitia besnoiti]PFH35646.1 hypothetical protein BESB_052970 [Besnoitia besnoiti]
MALSVRATQAATGATRRVTKLRALITSIICEQRLSEVPECRPFIRATEFAPLNGGGRQSSLKKPWLSPSASSVRSEVPLPAGAHLQAPPLEADRSHDQSDDTFTSSAAHALRCVAQASCDRRAHLSRRSVVGRTLACLAAAGMADDARSLLDACNGRRRTIRVELKTSDAGSGVHVDGARPHSRSSEGPAAAALAPLACKASGNSGTVDMLIDECPLYAFSDLVGALIGLELIDANALEALKRRIQRDERCFTARTLTYLSLSAKELPSPLVAEYHETLCAAVSSCISRRPQEFVPRLIARLANAYSRHSSRPHIQQILERLQKVMLDTLDDFDAPDLVLAMCEFGKVDAINGPALFSAALPRLRFLVPSFTPVDMVMLLATLEGVCMKTSPDALPAWPSTGPIRELAGAVLGRICEEGPACLRQDGRSVCRLLDIVSRMPREQVEGAVFDAVCAYVWTVEKTLVERQLIEIMNACTRVQRTPPDSLVVTVFSAARRLIFTCDPKYVALFWNALPAFLRVAFLEYSTDDARVVRLSPGVDETTVGTVRRRKPIRETLLSLSDLKSHAAPSASAVSSAAQAELPSACIQRAPHGDEQAEGYYRGSGKADSRSGTPHQGEAEAPLHSRNASTPEDAPALATRVISELCAHVAGAGKACRSQQPLATVGEVSSGSWPALQPRDVAMILNAMSRMELLHLHSLQA